MKPNIKWTSVAKTAIGVGTILLSAIALFSRLNTSEHEREFIDPEQEREPNEPEEDNEQLSYSKPEKREYKGYVPIGCSACGGPYPMCRDGCPIFDD
ncbi:MAG: hypothetical protein K2H01_02140 [Ruminococcus sp.]|nr:hypothetical protein [Ruminococcus sp.]